MPEQIRALHPEQHRRQPQEIPPRQLQPAQMAQEPRRQPVQPATRRLRICRIGTLLAALITPHCHGGSQPSHRRQQRRNLPALQLPHCRPHRCRIRYQPTAMERIPAPHRQRHSAGLRHVFQSLFKKTHTARVSRIGLSNQAPHPCPVS